MTKLYLVEWDGPTGKGEKSFGTLEEARAFAETLTGYNRSVSVVTTDTLDFTPARY